MTTGWWENKDSLAESCKKNRI
ncbi:hypothetical protein Q604_UNBc4C00149G0001, partial [human gut metagenome]